MIEEADLILTMTQSHKKQVIDVLPDSRNKVFTIKEYTLYKTPGSEKNNIGEKIALLASNLEKKEREFYSKYGNELKELKSKSDQLEKEIKKIEEDIQKWHLKLYEYTDKERHELKLMEEKMCDVDIDDPIGQPLEIYKKCSDELEKLIKIIIEKLL
jgi:protein-tyrosine phosphatase